MVILNIFRKVVLCLDIKSQQAIFLCSLCRAQARGRFRCDEAAEEVLMVNMFIAALYNILR